MNKSKTSKGITLIALIITIIVLLILAVVAINSVKETGIINYAQNAVDDYGEGQTKENEAIAGYMGYLNKYDPSKKDKDEDENDGNTLVAMYKAGTLKIGDYVSYTPNGATTYEIVATLTGSSESQTVAREELAWRVLGYDETNNQILLISSEPTFTGLVEVSSDEALANRPTILDSTCGSLYSNTDIGANARSIHSDDITKYFGLQQHFTAVGYDGELEEEEKTPDLETGRNILKNMNPIKRELLLGPESNPDEWNAEDFVCDNDTSWEECKASHIFCYNINGRAWDENTYDIPFYAVEHAGLNESLGGGNNKYLRPVVCLDSKTTVEQVSIIGEIENLSWTWYDVCGRQAGS